MHRVFGTGSSCLGKFGTAVEFFFPFLRVFFSGVGGVTGGVWALGYNSIKS